MKLETEEYPTLVDAEQLGEIVNMKRATILRLYREGKIPGLKYGHRTVRFNIKPTLEKLLELGEK